MAIGTFQLLDTCGTHPGGNRLSWTHTGSTADVTFQVQYKLDVAVTWTNLVVLPVTTTTYDHQDSSALCNMALEYRLLELTSGTTTDTSVTVACENTCALLPEDFTTMTLTCPTVFSAVRINWSTTYGIADHAAYVNVNIYRDVEPTMSTAILIGTEPLASGFYDDSNIQGGTTYYYRTTYVFTGTFAGNEGLPNAILSCTTPNQGCGSSGPLTTFDYEPTVSDECDNIQIYGLMNSTGTFLIPQSHACDDISTITSMSIKYDKCSSDVTAATSNSLTTSSNLFNSVTETFNLPITTDGVYTIQLIVNYTDQLSNAKTVTSTKCVLVSCNCLECDIAQRIIEDHDKADEMLLMYQGLQLMPDCGQCESACRTYSNLINLLDDGCNC